MSELKDAASFPHLLSTGQSEYVALHFGKTKVVKPQLLQEPGTIHYNCALQLLSLSLSSLSPTDTHCHSLTLCISACVCVQIHACMNSLSCSSLGERQRELLTPVHTHTYKHVCTQTHKHRAEAFVLLMFEHFNWEGYKTCSCLSRLVE